jgi:superfamily II DNA/RNA helicase
LPRLARHLTAVHVPAVELHGDLGQNARDRSLASFASGATRVMVATDIAARGIHVDGIDLVIHADPPTEHKAYLHRSGRTARAGAAGVVIILQTPAQEHEVSALMRKANVVSLASKVRPGFSAAALDRRRTGRADRASGTACGPGNGRGSHPGHRLERGRHVHALPGPRQALTRNAFTALAHSEAIRGGAALRR